MSVIALKIPFNGTNGSTNFVDVSDTPKALVSGGDAVIDTTTSIDANGVLHTTNGYVKTDAGSSDFVLDGDFTIECWCQYTDIANYATLFNIGWYGSGILVRNHIYINGINVYDGFLANNTTANTLFNVTVMRRNGIVHFCIDGNEIFNYAYAGVINSGAAGVMLGASSHTGGQENWKGFIDEFELTNRLAKYTVPFTPSRGVAPTVVDTDQFIFPWRGSSQADFVFQTRGIQEVDVNQFSFAWRGVQAVEINQFSFAWRGVSEADFVFQTRGVQSVELNQFSLLWRGIQSVEINKFSFAWRCAASTDYAKFIFPWRSIQSVDDAVFTFPWRVSEDSRFSFAWRGVVISELHSIIPLSRAATLSTLKVVMPWAGETHAVSQAQFIFRWRGDVPMTSEIVRVWGDL
jgi:hypothetical protein